MPNTLAHVGVQTIISRRLFKISDLKLVVLGCIIPDIPWILQRTLPLFFSEIDRLGLRAYCITQASLFFCLILAGALSLFFKDKKNVFIIVASNCFFHLLLDALQTKWANGVHFFVPFSWDLFSLSMFWPEDPITKILTLAGGFIFLFFAIKEFPSHLSFSRLSFQTCFLSAFLVVLYFVLPLLLLSGPHEKNNHYIKTLANSQMRKGKEIAIDRVPFDQKSRSIRIFTGESFLLRDKMPGKSEIISIQGIFVDNDSISVNVYHTHSPMRDIFSIVGILGALTLWLFTIINKKRIIHTNKH